MQRQSTDQRYLVSHLEVLQLGLENWSDDVGDHVSGLGVGQGDETVGKNVNLE